MNNGASIYSAAVLAVDNFTPVEPPGVAKTITDAGGWLMWGIPLVAVIAILIAAYKIMLGRNGRSNMAADGIAALPYIVFALVLAGTAGVIVTSVMS